jgi:hypothetical protein
LHPQDRPGNDYEASWSEPANDTGLGKLFVLRIAPIALCSCSWFYLQQDVIHRDASNGLNRFHDFIVVPAPVDPRDDARYMRAFRATGWYPKFANPRDPTLPFAMDHWDPTDPIGSLRQILTTHADWEPVVRENHLRNCRHIAI